MDMQHNFTRTSAHWLDRIFSAKAVAKGAIVRRSVGWVEKEIGRDRLIAEVKRRRFHMVESGGQFVIFCHRGLMRVVV
ncbi:N-(5'-phosphoribosyl)anthranilate isomerase [Palleronia sp. THAF1]|uniref:N-(5'-phosphoribosyl)anthranilate isomerase n=1 Tax=Palleronia sp. THAF1 TaxID=2587842 RepID=UPI0020C7E39F|nr:N-(5'-phosphoribosyl)anthranilate isomerase [Palleronia sp. THAF1]